MDGCSVRRTDRGFTLIEVLVAVTLLSAGVAVTIGVFASSDRRTLGAQRTDVAVQRAEAEIDEIAALKYGEIALTAAPTPSTDPKNPNSRVSGSQYQGEDLVLAPGPGVTAKVDPGPDSFVVGAGGSAITGKVYRFVSWRNEGDCSQADNPICDLGRHDTKRVTIAVTLDATPTQVAPGPIWVSSVIADKDALPPGSAAAPPSTPAVTAQSFYLFDTSCDQTQRQTLTASHDTHDTAASDSFCESSDPAKRPDLMGPTLPTAPDDELPPLYDYSAELSGGRPGGLAMIHRGTTCETSYPADGGTTGGLSKWNLHAWSTDPFASDFHLSSQVTISLFATAIDGASGRGALCAALVDRRVENEAPVDRLIGWYVFDIPNWPSSPRRLTFTFNETPQDVPAGHRLVLVLQPRGESDNDLVLLYDHPLYQSLLEVATTTPLTS